MDAKLKRSIVLHCKNGKKWRLNFLFGGRIHNTCPFYNGTPWCMYLVQLGWIREYFIENDYYARVRTFSRFLCRLRLLNISTNPLGEESRLLPKFVKIMYSGVSVPSLGHLFPTLEYWRPFEALARKCKNTTPMWTNIKYSFAWLTGM